MGRIHGDVGDRTGSQVAAVGEAEIESMLSEVGFVDVRIRSSEAGRELVRELAPDSDVAHYVVPALIEARKP